LTESDRGQRGRITNKHDPAMCRKKQLRGGTKITKKTDMGQVGQTCSHIQRAKEKNRILVTRINSWTGGVAQGVRIGKATPGDANVQGGGKRESIFKKKKSVEPAMKQNSRVGITQQSKRMGGRKRLLDKKSEKMKVHERKKGQVRPRGGGGRLAQAWSKDTFSSRGSSSRGKKSNSSRIYRGGEGIGGTQYWSVSRGPPKLTMGGGCWKEKQWGMGGQKVGLSKGGERDNGSPEFGRQGTWEGLPC